MAANRRDLTYVATLRALHHGTSGAFADTIASIARDGDQPHITIVRTWAGRGSSWRVCVWRERAKGPLELVEECEISTRDAKIVASRVMIEDLVEDIRQELAKMTQSEHWS